MQYSAKPEYYEDAQVTRAVADAVGRERTGIRLSPYTTFLDAVDEDPVALGSYLAEQLNPLGLAYLHMVKTQGWRIPMNGIDTVCQLTTAVYGC